MYIYYTYTPLQRPTQCTYLYYIIYIYINISIRAAGSQNGAGKGEIYAVVTIANNCTRWKVRPYTVDRTARRRPSKPFSLTGRLRATMTFRASESVSALRVYCMYIYIKYTHTRRTDNDNTIHRGTHNTRIYSFSSRMDPGCITLVCVCVCVYWCDSIKTRD